MDSIQAFLGRVTFCAEWSLDPRVSGPSGDWTRRSGSVVRGIARGGVSRDQETFVEVCVINSVSYG